MKFRRRGRRSDIHPIQALYTTLHHYSGSLAGTLKKFTNREWDQVKNILKGTSEEMAAILISLNLYPLGLVNFEKLEVLSSVVPKRPVLLIHGYFQNNSIFYLLKRRLRREGWQHVYSINLNTHSKSVESSARDISRKVDEILKDTGAERVDMVGHSLGGLCARYYIQILGGSENVTNCITIGTPHQGSYLAFFGLGPAHWDMQPGSDLLKELNEEYPIHEQVHFTNIWSPFDYMVIPIENSIMEGRVRNIQVDYVGHLGLCFSQKVFNEIFLTLSSDTIHRKLEPKKKAPSQSEKSFEFTGEREEKEVRVGEKQTDVAYLRSPSKRN